jgi:hypothetical protein
VVTLSGFAHSYWDKDVAEKAVQRVYGVRGVANDIEVKLSSTPGNRMRCRTNKEELLEKPNDVGCPLAKRVSKPRERS